MSTSSSFIPDSWETFNRLAKETLQYAPLNKEPLQEVFLKIEGLVFTGIEYLLHSTTFVEDNLCYLLSEIASGVIKSRKVYKGKRVRRRVSLGEEDAVEMGSENRRILGAGFDLFKLSRMDRESAAPLIKRIIRTLRISTSLYENILIAFSKEAKEYRGISDRLAELTLELRHGLHVEGSEDHLSVQREISHLLDELSLIELNTGCVEPNLLYGTSFIVEHIVHRIRVLQERILKAYSRLILKPVRDKSQSEMEAFDLFQSGSLGLSRAISLYDVRSGTSFPTFANWWIRQRIFGSTKHSSPLIKLPGSVWETYQKIKATERKLEADATRNGVYSMEDVAIYLGTSLKSVEQVIRKIQSTKIVPLDSLASSDDGESEGYSEKALLDGSIDDELVLQAHRDLVEKILDHVALEHRNLVCLRYGVIDNVSNPTLCKKQALREIFRQAACKAILQQQVAQSAQDSYRVTKPDTLPVD